MQTFRALSDSEMEIMQVIWQLGAPITTSQLRHLFAHKGWKIQTLATFLTRLVDKGAITAEEARSYPGRNLITRALGPDPEALSDSYRIDLRPGDYLLLCTDGLVSTVTDQEMEREILRGDDNACLDRLLDIARDQGAPDNVTAVLLRQQ